MELRNKGIVLFLIILIYWIIWDIFEELISKTWNYFLWGIWILLIGLGVYWLKEKTNFYDKKNSPKDRLDIMEQMGFYSVMIPLMYILGIGGLCLGIALLIFVGKDGMNGFIGMSIISVIVLIIAFFVGRSVKKNHD